MNYLYLDSDQVKGLSLTLTPYFMGEQQRILVSLADQMANIVYDDVQVDIAPLYAFMSSIQGPGGADLIGITDLGTYFSGSTVEDALQELGADLAALGDHGSLAGLADDDHPQYYNQTRGDARYSQLGHTHTIANVTNLQTTLDGKLNLSGGTMTGSLNINRASSHVYNTWSAPSTFNVAMLTQTGALGRLEYRFWDDADGSFRIARFNDVGAFVDFPIRLARSDGRVTFTQTPQVNTTLVSLVGHTHSGADITSGTVADARLPTTMGGKVFTGTTNVQMGATGKGVEISSDASQFAWLDFHTSNTSYIDYDARISASGSSNPTSGGATINVAAAGFTFNSNTIAVLASPAFTGTPTAPTATAGTNTTQLATTAFVQTGLGAKADLSSPALTGTPTAPTAAVGTNTTQIATTAFVTTALRSIPPTTQNAAYTFVAADGGRARVKNDTSAYTYTVNNSVHAAGDTLMVVNDSSTGNITIAQGSGVTLYLAGTTTTGNRTLAPRGTATIYMVSASVGYVSGPGVT